ncbi:MAG: UDP-N-acetylmuramate dehydrogenase [Actinomycetota bacterium]|nr:UDP-N-acetylmuramate dehydrogenase [Actinomycetota bacterium]
MSDPLGVLAAALGDRAQLGAPLGARTTYRVGGPAAVLVEADVEEDLHAVHEALCRLAREVPVLVVGQGSNLLVADRGFDGLVVVLGQGLSEITVPASPGGDGASAGTSLHVVAGGGARLPVVARQSAAAGLRGLEWAVGVPGSVGGAVRMNAGGHGADLASVLRACRVFDLGTGTVTDRGASAMGFGYRSSALRPGEVVVRADLAVRRGERARAEAAVADVVRWRRAHQPGGANAGSVFTNPPGDAAGRLVEAAGLKGYRHGSAAVSDKHANFVQADAGGSADDVRAVIEHVRAEVARRSGVELVPELVMVGFERALDGVVAVR